MKTLLKLSSVVSKWALVVLTVAHFVNNGEEFKSLGQAAYGSVVVVVTLLAWLIVSTSEMIKGFM
jgi:hypothetical protein